MAARRYEISLRVLKKYFPSKSSEQRYEAIRSFRAKDFLVFHWCLYNKQYYFSQRGYIN